MRADILATQMVKTSSSTSKLDALRDLVSFVQFKKRKKHPWRSVTFSKVVTFSNFTKSNNTPPWVFYTFFKLYK